MTPIAAPFKLLIVDDEPSVTLTLKLIFERQGYRVTTAYSCAEALKTMSDGVRYDAVVTDLNMEMEDIGMDVVRAAQKLHHRPVVVICTGYANMQNAQQALDMHVDYLATKPVDIQQLLTAMDRLLRRRAVREATA